MSNLNKQTNRWLPCGAAGGRPFVVLALTLVLGACSNYSTTLTPDLARLKETVAPRDLNVFQRREPMTGQPVPPDELVGSDGRCASEATASSALNFAPDRPRSTAVAQAQAVTPDAQPQTAPAPRGIALNMTECDVVRVAGVTDKVEIAANERGQRTVTLTYVAGERPGIYRFVSGRLVSIERGPEPPPPPKPQRPAKRQKQA